MSHFSVLVRLPADTQVQDFGDVIGRMLLPYKESGDRSDPQMRPYLTFCDEEGEYLRKYESESASMVRLPSGEEVFAYDDRFRNPYLLGPSSYVYPEGAVTFDKPHREQYATFEAYMADYCGYKDRDPVAKRYGHWHNPRAKWDWWSVGGRWTGFFLFGYEPHKDRDNYKPCWLCRGTGTRPDWAYSPAHAQWWKPTPAGHPVIGRGCNGCGATGYEYKFSSDLKPVGNFVRVREIDWGDADRKSREKLGAFWAEWEAFCGGKVFDHFDGPRSRALELGMLECKDTAELTGGEWRVLPWDTADTPPESRRNRCDVLREVTKDWLVENHSDAFSPLSTFARLGPDGWSEKGEMGWFGCSTATPDSSAAHSRGLRDWVEAGSPLDWLVIVDCHI